MNLLLRLALLWIVLGLVVGIVLRSQFKGRAWIPFVLSFTPWLVHMLYVIWYTLGNTDLLNTSLLIFVLLSLLVAIGVMWVGYRSLQRNGTTVLLTPILQALIYGLGPLFWFMTVLREQEIAMDSIPAAMFVGGTLFVSSMLLSFRFKLPSPGKLIFKGKR
jgi:hypothetical protein